MGDTGLETAPSKDLGIDSARERAHVTEVTAGQPAARRSPSRTDLTAERRDGAGNCYLIATSKQLQNDETRAGARVPCNRGARI